VIKLENANKRAMEDAIVRFEERLLPSTTGWFDCADHGI
jgi:hypothetical protein